MLYYLHVVFQQFYFINYLFIHITFLKYACRCVTTHVDLELICRVCFFIIFNQSDENGFGHLILSNVRCPVDQRSTRIAIQQNVGHLGHGHFGLRRFGPDIWATDVSATENAKGGRFGHNHKLWVGVCACINV